MELTYHKLSLYFSLNEAEGLYTFNKDRYKRNVLALYQQFDAANSNPTPSKKTKRPVILDTHYKTTKERGKEV